MKNLEGISLQSSVDHGCASSGHIHLRRGHPQWSVAVGVNISTFWWGDLRSSNDCAALYALVGSMSRRIHPSPLPYQLFADATVSIHAVGVMNEGFGPRMIIYQRARHFISSSQTGSSIDVADW